MFPFDKILLNRIKDLERLNEVLIGANSILERELEKAQSLERETRERLFQVSGISPRLSNPIGKTSSSPISLSNKTSNWKGIKDNLETQTKKDYWEQKKRENEKVSEGSEEKISELEKEVLDFK